MSRDSSKAAGECKVRLALENLSAEDFARLRYLFDRYPPGFLGMCYDSGHGLLFGNGLQGLERLKDRLIAVHLHDNDGTVDQHRLPFSGRVEWKRLAGILARSSYRGCVSLEVQLEFHPELEEKAFLAEALNRGRRLASMIRARRKAR